MTTKKAATDPNDIVEYPLPIPRTVTINTEQSQVFDLPPTHTPDHNMSSKDPLDLSMAGSTDSTDNVMQHAKEPPVTRPPSKQQPPSQGQGKHRKNVLSTAIPLIPAAEAPADVTSSDRIRLGICAMDKKARSKPMAEILSRLDETLFHVVFFGDDMIKNEPVEEWPECDVIIAFYSKGYPLQKAKEYVKLKKPFILNDLDMQEQLKDRRCVYDLLVASGIDVPRHVYLSRDDYVSTGSGDGNGSKDRVVSEFDDHIEVNGISIQKPFVEKPVDADDHNIAIYYPSSAGGGCKKLFRKIGNRSSEFYPDVNEVRRDGSYIYEEFLETQGTDVKMYTVGPEYGHAEARKSPTVDGKVQRNSDGKEIRFPVILTLREKEIARRIVLGFKQFVCGFDLLRVQEGHNVVSMVSE
jgi:inositol hexakisphosphate/diphosphoinositol-pentakisphosphate kinase